ncbi:helix-turn-helix domain-containing protein [Virgibacillus salexigens]|uniref:Putative transcriptional regulator n=1 Tax=Virgibacillus massiliensis TaxID=1462526 RepID=A0A024QAW5_9BACI|nr:helix-turn-helix transcriptional regulator [Virgibacillus massiliensis]CDQ39061.1 putative transcriptional regulator [Virgibacillus massiliensis]
MKVRIHLQEILKREGVSQNELAKRLNLSPSTVNDMCKKDIKRVNTDTIARIAEMFNIEDIREIISLDNVDK